MKRPTAKALSVATSLAVAGTVVGLGTISSEAATPATESSAFVATPAAFHGNALAASTDERSTFAERASREAADRAERIKKLRAAKKKAERREAARAAKLRAAAAKKSLVASGSPRAIGQQMAARRGWTGYQWTALERLWNAESGWSATAGNGSTGAYGIPQALPGSKMASAGSDWRTNPATQIEWGLDYIASRWGSPANAYSHFLSSHWY